LTQEGAIPSKPKDSQSMDEKENQQKAN